MAYNHEVWSDTLRLVLRENRQAPVAPRSQTMVAPIVTPEPANAYSPDLEEESPRSSTNWPVILAVVFVVLLAVFAVLYKMRHKESPTQTFPDSTITKTDSLESDEITTDSTATPFSEPVEEEMAHDTVFITLPPSATTTNTVPVSPADSTAVPDSTGH